MLNGYYVSYEKMIFDNIYLLIIIDVYNKHKFSFYSYFFINHKKEVKKLLF